MPKDNPIEAARFSTSAAALCKQIQDGDTGGIRDLCGVLERHRGLHCYGTVARGCLSAIGRRLREEQAKFLDAPVGKLQQLLELKATAGAEQPV